MLNIDYTCTHVCVLLMKNMGINIHNIKITFYSWFYNDEHLDKFIDPIVNSVKVLKLKLVLDSL